MTLDHINNDGFKEKKKGGKGSGIRFYEYLYANNFPRKDELQILCMNCNFGKRMNSGICPNKNHNMPMVIGNGPIP